MGMMGDKFGKGDRRTFLIGQGGDDASNKNEELTTGGEGEGITWEERHRGWSGGLGAEKDGD